MYTTPAGCRTADLACARRFVLSPSCIRSITNPTVHSVPGALRRQALLAQCRTILEASSSHSQVCRRGGRSQAGEDLAVQFAHGAVSFAHSRSMLAPTRIRQRAEVLWHGSLEEISP